MLALAAQNDLFISHYDIKNAFIQQKLDVSHLYLEVPDGMAKTLPNGEPAALHLLGSQYGLKQCSKLLYDRLKKYLTNSGFTSSIADRCCFIRGTGKDQEVVLLYVDDIVYFNPRANSNQRDIFYKKLAAEFILSPWTQGEANWILNCEVTRDWDKGTISINQRVAIEKLCTKFGLSQHDKSSIPMDPSLKLRKACDSDPMPSFKYATLVGAMLYLSLTTRPDIAHSIGVLSRYMAKPNQSHCDAALQVLKYLNDTRDLKLTYSKSGNSSPHIFTHCRKSHFTANNERIDTEPDLLRSYADADLAGDVDTRRSTSGYAILMSGGVIAWQSKLQTVVALSTAEAESYATLEAVKMLVHLRLLLRELGVQFFEPTPVYEDNAAAIAIATGHEQSKRSRHYQIKVAWLCEHHDRGTFVYEKVDTKSQLADAFTKALPRDVFLRFTGWMGLHQDSSISNACSKPGRLRI